MGEAKEREVWGSKLDFILSTLGYAVGLGNIWRFPFYCGRNGGAAFLVAYFLMMVVAGFPMFYLELLIGQYSGKPPHLLYSAISPLHSGLGYCMIMITTYLALYYNMVVAWALFYFGYSFFPSLPFAKCSNYWNNKYCFDYPLARKCDLGNLTYFTGACHNYTGNATAIGMVKKVDVSKESPSSQFWNHRVLRLAPSIADGGTPEWDLVLCLLVAWIIVAIFLCAGIKSVGKTVYFTTTFPYVVIFILIVRGCTLTGALEGIKFYIIPEWEKLQNAQVWIDAAVQIFFSLAVGLGGLGTLASYNHFHNNAMRDTMIVVFGNCLTSFTAGFAIFPILGHLALQTNTTVADVAAEGPGLTFVAYPSGISEIPAPNVWAVLFFFMLILLGINTEQVNVEVIVTALVDTYPQHLRKPLPRFMATVTICVALFLLGLSMTTPSGIYVLNLIDKYAAGWPIVFVAAVEVLTIGWVYGMKRFLNDIKTMMGLPSNSCFKCLGYPVNAYWVLNWTFLTPAVLIFILVFSWVKFEPISYDGIQYPKYAQNLGWVMSISTLAPLVIVGVMKVQEWTNFHLQEQPQRMTKPTSDWRPNKPPPVTLGVERPTELSVVAIKDQSAANGKFVQEGVDNVGFSEKL